MHSHLTTGSKYHTFKSTRAAFRGLSIAPGALKRWQTAKYPNKNFLTVASSASVSNSRCFFGIHFFFYNKGPLACTRRPGDMCGSRCHYIISFIPAQVSNKVKIWNPCALLTRVEGTNRTFSNFSNGPLTCIGTLTLISGYQIRVRLTALRLVEVCVYELRDICPLYTRSYEFVLLRFITIYLRIQN